MADRPVAAPKVQDAVRKMRDQRAAKFEDKTRRADQGGPQRSRARTTAARPTTPAVPGAARSTSGPGRKIGENGIRPAEPLDRAAQLPRRPARQAAGQHVREARRTPAPAASWSPAAARYHKRIERAAGLSLAATSSRWARASSATQSGRPLPQRRRPQEDRRVHPPQPGRGRPRQGLLRRAADDGPAHGPGKVTAAEGILQHQMSDDRRDGHRAQLREAPRAPGRTSARPSPTARTPAKKDEKLPWRGPRKWKQDDETSSPSRGPRPMDRFWDREKRAVVLWLETRMLVEPYPVRDRGALHAAPEEGHAGVPGGPHHQGHDAGVPGGQGDVDHQAVRRHGPGRRDDERDPADERPVPSDPEPRRSDRRPRRRRRAAGWEKVMDDPRDGNRPHRVAWEGPWRTCASTTSTTT